jgi:predicted murein hydrolase (TIGR00659 family)
MKELVHSPGFGVLISLLAYEVGLLIHRHSRLAMLNPLLLATCLLIVLLRALGISFEDYNQGGQVISFFLGPVTVALALPLYKQIPRFKANALPILTGIGVGAVTSILVVVLLARWFGFSEVLTKSLVPKSVTTPIGVAICQQMGGVPSISVAAIIITGVIGSILGPSLYKLLRCNDKIAFGVAMGASSHAIGTAKAMELGETVGAMSALAMAISGIVTVALAPLLWRLLTSTH